MSEEWKIEHDQRQYRLMLDRISAYHEKKLSICALLSTLKGLLSALELRNGDCVEQAISECGNLEIVYALECDRCEEIGRDFSEIESMLFEMDSVKTSISNIAHIAQERLDILIADENHKVPEEKN